MRPLLQLEPSRAGLAQRLLSRSALFHGRKLRRMRRRVDCCSSRPVPRRERV